MAGFGFYYEFISFNINSLSPPSTWKAFISRAWLMPQEGTIYGVTSRVSFFA